ncbi:hypothetical protein A0H81_07903 [Grifola frondosa]|uniref:Uncharacterized protein n=1 Tax=Grifola frondosa TaxID=5627 RepID=A0A1C7M7E1_GRIFR|nr:hypothetical protein A0H81_07903 [Grifola frondosa]
MSGPCVMVGWQAPSSIAVSIKLSCNPALLFAGVLRRSLTSPPSRPSTCECESDMSFVKTPPFPTDSSSTRPHLSILISQPRRSLPASPTITLPVSTSSTPPAATSVAAASSSNDSSIPVGTVVGACVADQPVQVARSQRRTQGGTGACARSGLESPRCKREGSAAPPSPNQQESDEKNFSMFKKSPSVRTAKTHTSEGDHVGELPPLNFTTYHPGLAAELASEQPRAHPFVVAAREDSGVSWGGTTVNDDSFLSMRSVRVESGTMSPTMVMAKMTPPATSSPIHRWESAEVLHAEEIEAKNPFTDAHDERRAGGGNPFFNANDMNRLSRGRGRTRIHAQPEPVPRHRGRRAHQLVDPPAEFTSSRPDPSSVASGASAHAFATPRAMRSLIAALELTQEEVEERLRVVSMQPSIVSGISSISGLDDESDIGEVREFPLPPSNTNAPH